MAELPVLVLDVKHEQDDEPAEAHHGGPALLELDHRDVARPARDHQRTAEGGEQDADEPGHHATLAIELFEAQGHGVLPEGGGKRARQSVRTSNLSCELSALPGGP